ncbi:50S ribosomal protein L3 [Candidatus Peregrinibacteria bacterium CG_4_9_14_0_2_um_filter_53_11]|nr:MAG: 50S ribosomal protein L3 [Candidatus Peregrinibacteria bacterium CG_4_9_14_0_2_um_filter_53_11]
MSGLLARKVGMTRVFQDGGAAVPVTVLSCPPSTVTHIKTLEKDGYNAVVLGFEDLKKPRKTKKFRFLREFRVENPSDYTIGDKITVDSLKEASDVKITGTSKGRGFTGTMVRYNFSGGKRTHGSHHQREPGSVGACAKPGRIHKGKRMAGRDGNATVTLAHRPVVTINSDQNLLLIKGPIPGPNGGLVIVRTS